MFSPDRFIPMLEVLTQDSIVKSFVVDPLKNALEIMTSSSKPSNSIV